jgi:hypothetical protein
MQDSHRQNSTNLNQWEGELTPSKKFSAFTLQPFEALGFLKFETQIPKRTMLVPADENMTW